MVAESTKPGSQTKPDPLTLDWVGVQFYRRTRGTNALVQRSFPWWAPSIEFALNEARRQNHLPKEERSYWTHMVVHYKITETSDGAMTTQQEIKL